VVLSYLLDTNILLYLLGGRLLDPIPSGPLSVSVMTEIELLSYPSLSPTEELQITNLLAKVQIIELSEPIKREAIRIRRSNRIKLPDAIIAASAITIGATLVSNDASLANVQGFSSISLRIN
jgi:predicted nucleic acid-binding protein